MLGVTVGTKKVFFIPIDMKAKKNDNLSIYFVVAMLRGHVNSRMVLSGTMCGELMCCYM